MSRSSVLKLPSEIRAWLDQELSRRAFSDYDDLTEQLKNKLNNHGLEIVVSRSSIGRYGKNLKNRINDIRNSTEAAKLLAESMDDDADAMSQATIALAQDTLFNMFINIREKMEDDEAEATLSPKELSTLSRAIGNLARASLPQKKWAKQVREQAEKVARTVEEKLNVQGLTNDTIDSIKRDILGIGQ